MRRMFSLKQLQEIADNRVEALVEGGTLVNAKPIYCHPIYIERDTAGSELRITMLIFNNSATAFTKETFKTFLDDLYTANSNARLMASGAVHASGDVIVVSFIRKYGDIYYITGVRVSDGVASSINSTNYDTLMTNVTLYDGVNKIN